MKSQPEFEFWKKEEIQKNERPKFIYSDIKEAVNLALILILIGFVFVYSFGSVYNQFDNFGVQLQKMADEKNNEKAVTHQKSCKQCEFLNAVIETQAAKLTSNKQ